MIVPDRPLIVQSPGIARSIKTSLSGGRAWWAHLEFTRINIEPIILRKKIEDVREVGASMGLRLSDRVTGSCR